MTTLDLQVVMKLNESMPTEDLVKHLEYYHFQKVLFLSFCSVPATMIEMVVGDAKDNSVHRNCCQEQQAYHRGR